MKKSRLHLLICLCLLVSGNWLYIWDGASRAAEVNLLRNPGFEEQAVDGSPVGWEPFSQSKFGNGIVLDSGRAYAGEWALAFTTPVPNAAIGMRSNPIPAVPGAVYKASVYIYSDAARGKATLYIDFWDKNKKRIAHQIMTNTRFEEWEKLEVVLQAPPEAVWVSIIVYRTNRYGGVQLFDEAFLTIVEEGEEAMAAETGEIEASTAAVGVNLLRNWSFEEQDEKGAPVGWEAFSQSRFGNGMVLDKGKAYHGQWSLAFTTPEPIASHGMRSTPIPAVPGAVYQASIYVYSDAARGKPALYIDFWDKNKKRIAHKIVHTSEFEKWHKLEVTLAAPPEAVWVSIIVYRTASGTIGIQHFDQASLMIVEPAKTETAGVAAGDLYVADQVLDYTPAHGSVVTTNPPSFIWVPPAAEGYTYTLEYSTDPNFSPEDTTRVDNIDISIYTPADILDADKTWYWRVRAFDATGKAFPPTSVRAFNISPDAAVLPLPPLSEVRAKIPPSHPRLYVTPDTLAEWRQKKEEDLLIKIIWRGISTKAVMAAIESLPPEPPSARPGGIWDVDKYREANAIANAVAEKLETLSFAYLISENPRYGEAARRLIMHVASWDPAGATSAAVNDDTSRPLLLSLSRAYTWAYHALSPEEREKVRQVIRIRGDEAYRILKAAPYESNPYGSHNGSTICFLGEVAIAFMSEIPEAEVWLDYVTRIFFAVYPAWGGDPGGWAEGPRYWGASMNNVFNYADAVKAATGLDLYRKPFFRNTGTHRLLTQPPYSKMGPFGDFADNPPTMGTAEAMLHLATVYQNPHYKWYADQLGASVAAGIRGYIRACLYNYNIKGESPVDYPTGAYYADIGWVVFHHRLVAPPAERLQFMFKSSPYGSFSHSLADQNSFTLEAFGTPLAISSGYRPWYGSVHHTGWTKTTQAHNSILVDGQGQKINSLEAKGEILSFLNGASFGYTAGEAARAYITPLNRFTRHVVYIRPDLFVLFDDLHTPKPGTFSWLLHTYHRMDIDPEKNRMFLAAGSATLDVRLWSGSKLTYRQTDQFAVPLDEPMDKPMQWHITATTEEQADKAYFLVLLAPAYGSEMRSFHAEPLSITSSTGLGLKIEEDGKEVVVLFRRFDGMGEVTGGGLAADGTVAAWRQSPNGGGAVAQEHGLLLAGGKSWRVASGLSLTSTVEIDAEMTIAPSGISGSIVYPAVPGAQPFMVEMKLPGIPAVERVNSTGKLASWYWDGDTGRLVLHLYPGEHQLTISVKN
ncbi:MAG TPA: DUF4962 domain-containing protein [Firmicutes bacterium]|nr:DUF4962 domain-containing protein [Bacillota bacterium]